MKEFHLTPVAGGVRIEGYPNGVKVVALDEKRARRLANLRLHYIDLAFARMCIDAINPTVAEPFPTREALWRCAVIHYIKCFGDNQARGNLEAGIVYRGHPPLAMTNFEYFRALRNQHFVHDENAYSQCLPGAIINANSKGDKIADIACIGGQVATWSSGDQNNLRLLIDSAAAWVTTQFDNLCNVVKAELEQRTHAELMAMDDLKMTIPKVEDIGKNRHRP